MADNIDHGQRAKEAEVEHPNAVDMAIEANIESRRAEAAALDAKIEAHEAERTAAELATEARILETELAVERRRSASATFGFALLLCIVLAALVVGGFWLYGRMEQRNQAAYAASPGVQPAPAPLPPPIGVPPSTR